MQVRDLHCSAALVDVLMGRHNLFLAESLHEYFRCQNPLYRLQCRCCCYTYCNQIVAGQCLRCCGDVGISSPLVGIGLVGFSILAVSYQNALLTDVNMPSAFLQGRTVSLS